MDETPLRRAYSAYHAMRTAVEDIDRAYTESVEGDPGKVFEDFPGLEGSKPEYFEGYMSGAFEASDAIGKHLSALYRALIEIDRELAPTRGTGR